MSGSATYFNLNKWRYRIQKVFFFFSYFNLIDVAVWAVGVPKKKGTVKPK